MKRTLLSGGLLFLAAAASLPAAPVIYRVSVNTGSLTNTAGFVDLQFNPGGAAAQAANAVVSGFTLAGGSLALNATDRQGGASGTLPGTVTLNNAQPLNELFQGITFGSQFSFLLTLSGPALDNPGGGSFGSSFGLSLYGSDEITPLLTGDPDGTVLRINLASNGQTSIPTGSGNPAAVTAVALPEPSTVVMLGAGMAGLLVLRRRRSGTRHAPRND